MRLCPLQIVLKTSAAGDAYGQIEVSFLFKLEETEKAESFHVGWAAYREYESPRLIETFEFLFGHSSSRCPPWIQYIFCIASGKVNIASGTELLHAPGSWY